MRVRPLESDAQHFVSSVSESHHSVSSWMSVLPSKRSFAVTADGSKLESRRMISLTFRMYGSVAAM